MDWDDSGYLLSKNKYNENSLIVEIFTENHGKVSGVVFGGTSKKIKNYLQIGNKLYVNYKSKTENRIGYFKLEIINAFTPLYFDNKKKLSCISSGMNLIKVLTVESQVNKKIFDLIDKFFIIIAKKNWIKYYIFWELELLKLLGYHLELDNMVKKELKNNKVFYFVKSTSEKKIIPNFLIDKDIEVNDINVLLKGLKLVSDYLEKSIFKPNNINHPNSRLYFVDLLK
tara:strand:- start:1020 stop:1700 length:681 start_codon:yes stop_codon:yes gene_type:complete